MLRTSAAFAAGLAVLALAGAVRAERAQQPPQPRPQTHLPVHARAPRTAPVVAGTGDWGGRRSDLIDRGYSFIASEVIDAAIPTDGVSERFGRAAGQLTLGATIDTHEAWGLPAGGRMQVTITNRHGNSLTNDAGLDLLQPVQTVYGRGTIWRLSQFWYEQSFNDGATAIKVGRLTHSDDYGATPCGNLMNLTLCGPASSQIVNSYLYNFPVSSWGVRLRQRLAPDVHVNLGVIESNPVNLQPDKGFYLGASGATGTIYAGEIQWTPRFGAAGDLPGTYKIGGWYDTSPSNNIVYDVNGDYQSVTGLAFAREGRHSGIHANVLQQLIAPRADGAHGLTLVGNFAIADHETNRLRGKAAMILSYTGLIPGRARDDLTIGVGSALINDRVTEAQIALNESGLRTGSVQKAEVVAEINYGYRATPWLTVRPGVQVIHHPAGRSDRQDIFVAGVKIALTL